MYGINRELKTKEGKKIIFSSGNGCCVKDSDGTEYIDFILGYGPVILGHGNKEFNKKFSSMIQEGFCFPMYGKIQSNYKELLEDNYTEEKTICFHKTGSESVIAALNICYKITGKQKYIRFGYNGWYPQLIFDSINWHEPVNSTFFNDKSIDIDYGYDEIGYNLNNACYENFLSLVDKDDVSCLIFDSFQLERFSNSSFMEIINYCKTHGIFVIMDETKTSGRVDPFGYYRNKIYFDFTIIGKAIGNGVPISVLIGKKNIVVEYEKLKIGGTYSRDNIGPAGALVTYDIMSSNNTYNEIIEIGNKLVVIINKIIEQNQLEHYVNIKKILCGSILEFEYAEHIANSKLLRRKLNQTFINNGLLIPDGHCFYICREHGNQLKNILEKLNTTFHEWKKYL